MPKEKKQDDYGLVIDQLTANTKELLTEYYSRANALRDDEDTVNISISHRVEPNKFGEMVAKSKIAFGKRVRDEVEHTIDMTAQFEFEPKGKAEKVANINEAA